MVKNSFVLLLLLGVSPVMHAQQKELKELDATLKNYPYPFEVAYLDMTVQEQTLTMAYMDVTPGHYNGNNILLLHGKNFNGAYWRTTVEALTKSGYRVIVPDQIGFGKSSKPANLQYSFHQLARNTKALLDTLGVKKTAVLGHSMGGMLATRFALMYPDVVEKLILENPIGLEDYKTMVPYRTVDEWYKDELKKDYQAIREYQRENYYGGQWKPAYDEWVNILAGWTRSEDYPDIAWNAALTYDMIFTQPVVYEFPDIRCPTLLIIGTRDRTALGKPFVSDAVRKTMGLYRELGRKTQAKIAGSTLVEIENTGHLPHIESFEKFIDPLLKFLKQ